MSNTNAEMAKMKWALETSKGGSTPLKRIYSTMRQLGSSLNFKQVEEMVKQSVNDGLIRTSPHPLHENEFFYSLAAQES